MTDPSGAIIVAARIVVREFESTVERTGTTDANGRYHIAPLAPRVSRATAQATGFRTASLDVTHRFSGCQTIHGYCVRQTADIDEPTRNGNTVPGSRDASISRPSPMFAQVRQMHFTLGDRTSHISQGALAFFAQDVFRWRPTLAIEAGIRYEWNMTPTERDDRFVVFDAASASLESWSVNGTRFPTGEAVFTAAAIGRQVWLLMG